MMVKMSYRKLKKQNRDNNQDHSQDQLSPPNSYDMSRAEAMVTKHMDSALEGIVSSYIKNTDIQGMVQKVIASKQKEIINSTIKDVLASMTSKNSNVFGSSFGQLVGGFASVLQKALVRYS